MTDSAGVPPSSSWAISSNIACMIAGTPANTYTFSIRNPGAWLTGFLTSAAPSGMRAMRRRASFSMSGG